MTKKDHDAKVFGAVLSLLMGGIVVAHNSSSIYSNRYNKDRDSSSSMDTSSSNFYTNDVPDEIKALESLESSESSFDDVDLQVPYDDYESIRQLKELTGIDIDELDLFIDKYSNLSKHTYNESVAILENNMIDIKNDYSSLKEGMITTLFDYAEEEGRLSTYSSNDIIETRYVSYENALNDVDQYNLMLEQRGNQEEMLLDLCEDLEMNNAEKAIALSIFRLETGNGNSYACVYGNNYGGIKLPGEYNQENCIFQTPEFGAYKSIKCMLSHIKQAESNGYIDPYSIIYSMGNTYNVETPESWVEEATEIYEQVNVDYNYFNDEEKKIKKGSIH